MGVSLASSSMYPQSRMSMPNNYFAMPGASGPPNLQIPPQPLPQGSYDAYDSTPAHAPLPQSHRPSSGAWTINDDQQLMAARAQGLNWSQIKDTYFPNKTANACRKRHERLAERRDADDWDQRKFQRMAKEYMNMRKEIWAPLAARTGEKWNVVEAKVRSKHHLMVHANRLSVCPTASRTSNQPRALPRATSA